jgi:acetylserotonin N-methyltransferase
VTAPTTGDGPIWDVFLAAFHAPALAVADELGLFAALDRAPATVDELAASLAIEPRATQALVGLAAALGFATQAAGRYHLTDVARIYLVPGGSYYWGGFLARIRAAPIDCAKLVAALRRGSADGRVAEMWQAPPPEALRAFTHAMHAHSFALAMRTVDRFGLPPGARVLDAGGGSGSYSIAIALHDPTARATVLDFAPVCEVARAYAAQHGVADRVAAHTLDLFADAWPDGHDAAFLSDVFHDWTDAQCVALAARAFAALPTGGRILVHELLLDDTRDAPLVAAAYSVVMLFNTPGRQRTGTDLVGLLDRAGFESVAICPTANGYAIVSARKPM